jgi:hypothetical protein
MPKIQKISFTISPYFKAGDDLAHLLKTHGKATAFRLWAAAMAKAATHVNEIADAIDGKRAEITAEGPLVILYTSDRDIIESITSNPIVHQDESDE